MLDNKYYFTLVSKDLTGFELPPLPTPKGESESTDNKETKPDLNELWLSLLNYVKGPLESLKKFVLNEKNVSF